MAKIEPEIIYMHGAALVPAKALEYKRDHTGQVIEQITPRTHSFENLLKDDLRKQLANVKLFPTDKEVIVCITHGINSSEEYNKLDLDNRAKTILDALKDVVYKDDSQVKILFTDKIFLKNKSEDYYRFSVKILDETCFDEVIKNLKVVIPY